MHCAPKQQHTLARMLVTHLGDALLSVGSFQHACCVLVAILSDFRLYTQYDELVATKRAVLLSPIELRQRFMLKGKVNLVPMRASGHQGRSTGERCMRPAIRIPPCSLQP
jgi:hypothetical protein